MHHAQDELPVAEPARVYANPANQILVALRLRGERPYASSVEFER